MPVGVGRSIGELIRIEDKSTASVWHSMFTFSQILLIPSHVYVYTSGNVCTSSLSLLST